MSKNPLQDSRIDGEVLGEKQFLACSVDEQLDKDGHGAAHHIPINYKKHCQQKHLGLNSPYQSYHGAPRLDLHIASKNNLSSFTQRVMSAKLLRLKQLQNQLAEANLQLNELYTENRLLRALQKRQDLALDRYEGAQAQLPQLVNSHHEEVRVLRTKYRNLRLQYRDVSKKLKDREAELLSLKEQNTHLLKLSQDRQLEEREALSKQVLELQSTVSNQKNTIQVLNRRVLLETKNLKHQLQVEMQRHRATQIELQDTLMKMENLQSQLEQTKERQGIPTSMLRSGKSVSHPCSRLPGLRRPTATNTLRKIQQSSTEHPSNKLKCLHEYTSQNILPSTDPSSDQPDSSMATFSEKTNEFSTSIDSSPEHAIDVISTSDTSSTAPVHRPLSHSILKSTSKDETFKNSKIESPRKGGSLPAGDLDTEYKKALDMLSELSSKDHGDFEQEISCSLSAADFATAKHVADLASVASTMKSISRERSSSFGFNNFQNSTLDTALPVMKELQSKESKSDSPQKERRILASMGDAPPFKENHSDKVHQAETKTDKTQKMPWEEYTSTTSNKYSTLENISVEASVERVSNSGGNPANEDEDFRKEALLKALKAIDDETALQAKEDNESDDSDTGIIKHSKSVLPVSMFTSINSSGAGIKRNSEFPIKRRPFK